MVAAADESYTDAEVSAIERSACPTCGSCSGMFTANSMNCLTEALGLSLPGNGSTLATHSDRERLFREAGRLRSEEHTSELQSLMRSSYAVFCFKKNIQITIYRVTQYIHTNYTNHIAIVIARYKTKT